MRILIVIATQTLIEEGEDPAEYFFTLGAETTPSKNTPKRKSTSASGKYGASALVRDICHAIASAALRVNTLHAIDASWTLKSVKERGPLASGNFVSCIN